jgi:hypothetical protein
MRRVDENPCPRDDYDNCLSNKQQVIRWFAVVYVPLDFLSKRRTIRQPNLIGRDPDYRKLNVEFTIDVMKAAHRITVFPDILKPWALVCLIPVPG